MNRARTTPVPLSAQDQTKILSMALTYQAREVWVFGSSVAGVQEHAPHDIDVAVLGVPRSMISGLKRSLTSQFEDCRVDEATCYKSPGYACDDSPLHFILADNTREFWKHPISRSIRRGICLCTPA